METVIPGLITIIVPRYLSNHSWGWGLFYLRETQFPNPLHEGKEGPHLVGLS